MKTHHTEQEKRQAKHEIKLCKLLIDMAEDNELPCGLEINGIKLWLCDNSKIIPALEAHVKEIMKFLNGKPNKYE